MKKPADRIKARVDFYNDLSQGALTLADTVRRMRAIAGKTQAEYAELVGVAPRIIIDLERGVGNPTLKTLEKIGAPFGLRIAFRSTSPARAVP